MNHETRVLLAQWDFCAKSVDEACDFLDWLAWGTYEFETGCSDAYIPSPCIPTCALLCVLLAIVLIMTTILVLIIILMMGLLDLVL